MLEMEEWRKLQSKKKCREARQNDKLVVGTGVIYKINMKGGKVEKC